MPFGLFFSVRGFFRDEKVFRIYNDATKGTNGSISSMDPYDFMLSILPSERYDRITDNSHINVYA